MARSRALGSRRRIGGLLVIGLLFAAGCADLKEVDEQLREALGTRDRTGRGSAGGAEADPNPPDPSFMAGAIPPPAATAAPVSISYTARNGDQVTRVAVPGQVIAFLEDGTPSREAAAIFAARGASVLSAIPRANLYLLEVAPGGEAQLIQELLALSAVDSATLNGVATPFGLEPREFGHPDWTRDGGAPREYLERVEAPAAWALLESPAVREKLRGSVTLGVVDKGFNPGTLVDDLDEPRRGGLPTELGEGDHGLLVASYAVAEADDLEQPVGVNWHSPYVLKAKTTDYDYYYAILELVVADGIEVINFSAGECGPTANNGRYAEPEDARGFYARSVSLKIVAGKAAWAREPRHEFLIVAAAGNDFVDMDWPELRHANLIYVGTYAGNTRVAPYSNHGQLVDLFVPGTTGTADDEHSQGAFPAFEVGGATWKAGTSYAAPVVAGVVCLVWELLRSTEPVPPRAADVRQALLGNTYPGGAGHSLLDMEAAIQAALGEPQVPAPPRTPSALLAISRSAEQIDLAWTIDSTDETGFEIERKQGATGTYAEVGQVGASSASYSDTGLAAATEYHYRVRAINRSGGSGYSNEASAATQAPPALPPLAPSALAATALSTTGVRLGWSDASDDETGFLVERKQGAAGTYAEVDQVVADVTTWEDGGLTPATEYVYRVRASNGAGPSSFTNEAAATTHMGWTHISSGQFARKLEVWGTSSSNLYVVGSDVRRFDGTTWTQALYLTGLPAPQAQCIWGSASDDVFVGWNQGVISHFDGAGWTTSIPAAGTTYNSIWGSSRTNVFAVGTSGTILHHDGTSWTSLSSGSAANLTDVSGSSASHAFAVGASGTILRYDGASWSAMTSQTTGSLFGVWVHSSDLAYAVGGSSGVGIVLRHDGTSWSQVATLPQVLSGVWGTSPTDLYAVGWARVGMTADGPGSVFHFDGTSWSNVFATPDFLGDVWGLGPGEVYVVGGDSVGGANAVYRGP